jgi:hypothetical protein
MKSGGFGIILGCLLAFTACNKESSEVDPDDNNGNTLDCTSVPKTFTDVKSIFANSCGGATCHGSGSNAGPGPLTTYAQIAAAKTGISAAVASGSMPKNSTLSTASKNSILCWINDGAKDN